MTADDIKALAAHVKEQADALYEVEHPERTAKLYLASKAITTLSDQLTAKTELATLYAASLRQSEEEVEGLRRDAERYRWLRSYFVSNDESWDDRIIAASESEASLDECIDAALSQTKEQS